MNTKLAFGFSSLAIAGVLLNGCGSSNGGGGSINLSDLSQIPNASQMVKANGSSRSLTLLEQSLFGSFNLERATPPKVSEFGAHYEHFWPTALVSDINNNWVGATPTQKNDYRSLFFGKTVGGPSGAGACQMAMASAEAMGRVLSGAGTMCYMKNVVSLAEAGADGVVISNGAVPRDVFKQSTSDKKVRVTVNNMPNQAGQFQVDFVIKGSNSIGIDKYAYTVHMCENNSGWNIYSSESMTADKITGLIEMANSSVIPNSSDYYSNLVQAHLKNEGDEVAFDLSKERIATSYGVFSLQDYRGKVVINGDNVITNYRKNSGAGYAYYDYSRSSFSGDSMANLRFLSGAYKGKTEYIGNTFTYDGAADYQQVNSGSYPGTYYVAVDPSAAPLAQSTEFQNFSFSTDSFLSGSAPSAPNYSSHDCTSSWSPDVTITLDFSKQALITVRNACESENVWDSLNFELCRGQERVENPPNSNNWTTNPIAVISDAYSKVTTSW